MALREVLAPTTFKWQLIVTTVFVTPFPLNHANTFTANKIQGQSLESALVDLKSTKGTQALYVMISRVVSSDNLAVMRWFPSGNVDHRLSPEYRNEFESITFPIGSVVPLAL